MPRGYRLAIVAAGVAVLFCAFGIGAYTSALTHAHYERECSGASNRAAYAKQRCPQQVDTDRAGLPYLAQSIASNPEPEDGTEREKRDLFAQESAALWGFWSLMVAACSAAITAIGTGFLLWQIILTREAVSDTGKATVAMEVSNAIMRADQRAWLTATLTFDFVSVAGTKGWIVSLLMKIENIGRTPADNVTWDASPYDDLGLSMRWIDMMISNEGAWETVPKPYQTPITILPGEVFEDQELLFIDEDSVPTLRLSSTSVRVFLTTDYGAGEGIKGRTITSFIIGPEKMHEPGIPGFFDLSRREMQTDIIVKRLGTVLAR